MTPDHNWLFRLPLIKDAIGIPHSPLKSNADYLWAISTAVPGFARICFSHDDLKNQATAFIEMAVGMNSIVVNTGRLIDATPSFDVAKADVVYIGGFQDFSYTALFLNGEHCLTPMHLKPPSVHPLRTLFSGAQNCQRR